MDHSSLLVMWTPRNLKLSTLLHYSPVDENGGVLSPPFPVVHSRLLSLGYVEGQVVILALLHGYRRECYGYVVIRQVAFVFLGTGTIVVCLKHVGIITSIRDMLKISVKTPARWSAHTRSTRSGILSGPAALCMLTCLKV